jgi:hypothetical protein
MPSPENLKNKKIRNILDIFLKILSSKFGQINSF